MRTLRGPLTTALIAAAIAIIGRIAVRSHIGIVGAEGWVQFFGTLPVLPAAWVVAFLHAGSGPKDSPITTMSCRMC